MRIITHGLGDSILRRFMRRQLEANRSLVNKPRYATE